MIQIGIFVLLLSATAFGDTNGTQPSDRIIGGVDARLGQIPYIASLQKEDKHICGASIIDPRWLLTAAHCICMDTKEYTVLVGTTTLNSGTLYNVERFIPHPSYQKVGNQFLNDIGLIRTTLNIVYTDIIKPIQIFMTHLGGGLPVLASGWGQTANNSAVSMNLKYVFVTSMNDAQCASVSSPYTALYQICTAGSIGTCRGDSGGPLVYNEFLVGITSSGPGDCGANGYKFFTRVLNYLPWINQNFY